MSASAPAVEGDLRNLVLPSPLYTVLVAAQSQMQSGADALIESLAITYMVNGYPGTFTVELPIVGFRVFENGIDLTAEAETIIALYAL